MARFKEMTSVTAISHLSVVSSWHGFSGGTESSSAIYNPPPGWVILDTDVVVESSNSGWQSTSTLAGGLRLATEDQFTRVYNAAITAAGKEGKKDAAGKLREELQQRVGDLHKYSTNRNTIESTVSASTQGSFLDRMRGWEQISVTARIYYIGAPSDDALVAELEVAYGIHFQS